MFKEKSVILVFLLALFIAALSIIQLYQTIFVLQLLQGVMGIAIIAVFIVEIVMAIRSKEKQPIGQRAKKWILFIIAVLLIPIASYLVRTDGGKKIVVSAEGSDPPANIKFYLFGDNTFKLWHSGPVSGTYYRGSATIQDDTLNIHNENVIYLYPTLSFVIREGVGDNSKYLEPVLSQDSMGLNLSLTILKGEF